MAKSWQEKFDAKPHHDIKVIEKDFWGQKAGDRMLIPSPKMIQAYLDDSESTDLNLVQLRKDLAKKLSCGSKRIAELKSQDQS